MVHAPGYSLRFGVSTKCLSCFGASERGSLSCMTQGKHCTPLESLECSTSSGSFGHLVGRKINLSSLAMMGWLDGKRYFSREYLFVEDARTTWNINLQHNCRSLIYHVITFLTRFRIYVVRSIIIAAATTLCAHHMVIRTSQYGDAMLMMVAMAIGYFFVRKLTTLLFLLLCITCCLMKC